MVSQAKLVVTHKNKASKHYFWQYIKRHFVPFRQWGKMLNGNVLRLINPNPRLHFSYLDHIPSVIFLSWNTALHLNLYKYIRKIIELNQEHQWPCKKSKAIFIFVHIRIVYLFVPNSIYKKKSRCILNGKFADFFFSCLFHSEGNPPAICLSGNGGVKEENSKDYEEDILGQFWVNYSTACLPTCSS